MDAGCLVSHVVVDTDLDCITNVRLDLGRRPGPVDGDHWTIVSIWGSVDPAKRRSAFILWVRKVCGKVCVEYLPGDVPIVLNHSCTPECRQGQESNRFGQHHVDVKVGSRSGGQQQVEVFGAVAA